MLAFLNGLNDLKMEKQLLEMMNEIHPLKNGNEEIIKNFNYSYEVNHSLTAMKLRNELKIIF